MKLTLLSDKYVRAWPRHEIGARAYRLDAGRALQRSYRTDAHLSAYVATVPRRLDSGAVVALPDGVTMTAAVFDVDCGEVHGTSEPVPDVWRRAELEKARALDAAHPGLFTYDSRGGYRIVYALLEPTVLHTREDVFSWSRFYKIGCAYLERRFGIAADLACSDWTRLFRLPHATRDPEVGPERRATFGDVGAIGALMLEPTDEDVANAAARSKPAPAREINFTAPGCVDSGLLFWLLRNRGDVGDEAPRGGWICRCPNRAQHTVNSDGTDSTTVYPARDGGEIGAISCLHSHCEHLSLRDWLGFFTDAEKDEARRMAGIQPRGRRAA